MSEYILDDSRLELLSLSDENQKYSGDLVAEMANKLIELRSELSALKEAQRWIPTSERLPEDDGKYITRVCYPGMPEKAAFIDCRLWIGGHWDMFTSLVTHWKPLPPPPESEG